MDKWRNINGKRFNYLGSSETKENAKIRAKKTGKKTRITKYYYGCGRSVGYDIWVDSGKLVK